MIDKNDRLKVPKRLYIMDYQLEPCKIDGISDARLNAFPFNTTNGKLVEYLCLDALWHPASEVPDKDRIYSHILYEIDGGYDLNGFNTKMIPIGENWTSFVENEHINRWLYIADLFPKEGGEK